MELMRSSFCAVFLLVLLLSAVSTPCLSTGRLLGEEGTEEVYEIDYRGPETHSSSLPPPNHSHHGSPSIHRASAREPARESKKTINTKHKARKIHS